MYIMQIPVISILHLPPEMLRDMIDSDNPSVTCSMPAWADFTGPALAHPEGGFIMPANRDDWPKVPDEIRNIYTWAERHAVDGWVCLHNDGDVVAELPTY